MLNPKRTQNMMIGNDASTNPSGGEIEQPAQVPILKNPDERPVGRQDRERVHRDRLDRQ